MRNGPEAQRASENAPVTDDGKVILDTLVVDIRVGLEAGHGDLGRANGFGGGGHAGGQPLEGPRRGPGGRCEGEHGEVVDEVEETRGTFSLASAPA